MEPQAVVSFLNEYMTAMTTIIEDEGGIVDKFIGDGIMAEFLPVDASDNHALRAVRAGMSTVHPGITRKLLERISLMSRARTPGAAPIHSDGLTAREVEILVGVSKGLSSRELAAKLFVSESTVKSHLRTIYRKIGVRDRSQAVAYAIRKGFIR
jgi:DNA-binding NarL/FixJ family response regulator